MALQSRHRWVINRISDCFDLDTTVVETFIRVPDNMKTVTQLFSGEGPPKLFVFNQPRDIESPETGDMLPGDGPPILFFTLGLEERLRRRCCYFLRNTSEEGKSIDMTKASDAELLFGELPAVPLGMLETVVSRLYKPSFEKRSDWGKATDEQRAEFVDGVARFVDETQESLKSMVAGVELRKPDKRYDLDVRNIATKTKEDAELVPHCESLLEEWCDQIEVILEDKEAAKYESSDAGPMTELEYWRRRMQRLTSITEQVKSREMKYVIAVLSSVSKGPSEAHRQKDFNLLRRWKGVDVNITEAANEAKDNVKYLLTFDKFIDPLYTCPPETIIDTLASLMGNIKMIHGIARYYNTSERITTLFVKITNQMIIACKKSLTEGETSDKLWDKDPEALVKRLESCLKLNEAYQEQYRLTRDKALTQAKSKQFDFPESQIFGKFDLFCRRVVKLIDMFSTIHQFRSLASHQLEGMETLIERFFEIVDSFKAKRHDLLDYHNNKFDRDFVEFNVQISELEAQLQQFINQTFESMTSIEHSLNLLKKFQTILQRDALKSDLDSRYKQIFANYGLELENVQSLYEKHKSAPPIPRNLPPVAGNITWSRHLLKRIEEPMKKFESNQNVLASKDAKRIIKTYNKCARTLVAFEFLWYQAWVQSIDTAKAGLQATLIIRHPEDGKLYVNFDQEIFQLIREAKCLDRMGIEIPESAKIVLLQEAKFKSYFNDLQYALQEYERVCSLMLPVTAKMLKPHIQDLEYKLRPGMITLTWTSMNIDAYKHHIHTGLSRLEALIRSVNDIIENRIEKNLKIVSKSVLVDLPDNQSFSLEAFVSKQQRYIDSKSALLLGKNVEIENAVLDVVTTVKDYPIDGHIEAITPEAVEIFRVHYNKLMYQALLNCVKSSLNNIKKRVGSRGGTGFLFVEMPFFEVDVQLAVPSVRLSPSLDDVQRAINKCAQVVLKCTKALPQWGQQAIEDDADKTTFFDEIAADIEIVRVVLLLTGSIQGTKKAVADYLETFKVYDWLWKDDKDAAYKRFMDSSPKLEDYERELKRFMDVEKQMELIAPMFCIGALSLNTKNLKLQLKHEGSQWKVQYSDNLHNEARVRMDTLFEYVRMTNNQLNQEVKDLDSLRNMMDVLRQIRERESGIDLEINPVLDMYGMLERFLPAGYMDKDEMDQRSVLRSSWRKLVDRAEDVTDHIAQLQVGFKRQLLRNIKEFMVDVAAFRNDYTANGPMVRGIKPQAAMERLKRFKAEFEVRERKYDLYRSGEELFALKQTDYPEMTQTKKELQLLDKLYDLYREVMEKMVEWRTLAWKDVIINIQKMTDIMDSFQGRCRKMPKKLRDWDAYVELKQKIEDFQTVLPLLTELSKESIKPRHWSEVMKVTGKTFTVDSEELKLQTLLDADLVTPHEEVEEICEGADKELGIESKLAEIKERWALEDFDFMPWKGRSVQVLKGVVPIVEELEEAQMQLQTMLTMRHVAPFKAEVQAKLSQLSDTSDTLERWLKVQMLWCSLESVFTGGDIAKQMPLEAKKFAKVDKDWVKIMAKAEETCQVVNCCSNELLRNTLPVMYSELEKCQKSLEGYLEQKRNKFPRFYFVSNPVLLQILSQGSDPAAVQQYYEKIFDSISFVEHDKADPSLINAIVSRKGRDEERIPLESQVKAQGNIEEWLMDLLREHQRSMKAVCGEAAADIGSVSSDIETLRSFVDKFPGQFALLGIQLLWTSDMQYALENCKAKKTIMKDTLKKCADVLRIISSWCLQDLGSKMNRTKIETMVTIQVHQRDCTADINSLFKNRKITSSDDFEWLKQARFRWDPDEEDEHGDGACIISVADVDFKYSYEYLGCKDRLVITPLTDRCYITLSQALGMYFGGAPAGPAGTGKTETVKDMGRALGIYVVVTNCTDQMRYTDCAKIFKGLCQGGLWGCFDEFNRITLPVLSVVAQQVLAIQNAKKGNVEFFQFPGDPQNVLLNPVCGFFITMNPGYAGRQELPENLKALFRGVAMMVPDREIIMKVKLCAVGYTDFTGLSKKFFTLYSLCEEQLSKQNHYDFGLRNILSVLRTAGQTKRDNLDKDEQMLLYRTLRDMNLSKLIAQDVPLFLSLLEDLFPSIPTPAKAVYADMLAAIEKSVKEAGLVMHDAWVTKVIQLYETTLVRHGIMLSGPTGGGKSRIFEILQSSLAKVSGTTYKMAKLNPKAIRAAEMYGEADPMSGEWTTGVFASMWAKYNQRSNKFNTWIVADGPVDAIWIEDLNTVLDDNRILTLANGDRIPMTDNTKIMFEVECLDNASPATVSRAGIVYVSDTDLDWLPIVDAWLLTQPDVYRTVMRDLFLKYVGTPTPVDPGHIYNFLTRQCTEVIMQSRAGKIASMFNLLQALIEKAELAAGGEELYNELEKLVLYAVSWGIGGLLEPADRSKWDAYMRTVAPSAAMPACDEGETIFEYYVDYSSLAWEKWRPPEWLYPDTEELDFSNLLVPTMDSTRALFLLDCLHSYRKPIMMVGGPGTAKTSCALLFCSNFDPDARTLKRVNFSSATTSGMFQATIEAELDKRGGKNYGPPSGKKMTVFLDDVSMPHINEWGDQPTNEIVRQLVESHGFMFLDKDKRGDFKVCEDLDYVGAMGHPGGGKNDIPMRLKRQFFIFNLILPSITSINDIYGQMLSGRFPGEEFDDTALEVVNKLTTATIELWHRVRDKMLPTPAKFHYVFNMRELSRVFQGVLLTPKDIIKTGGQQCPSDSAAGTLLTLWKHECERVFCDKLTNNTDKDWYVQAMEKLLVERFGVELAKKTQEDAYFVDFFREDVYDEDDILVNLAPKIYEQGGSLETVRERVTKFMNQHNEENSARPLPLVLFDDALRHMLRISRVIEMPRGNALLVGVGGSGKQSLTRLAAFIARHECRQITLTKSYNVSSLMDDLRELYDLAGHQRKDVTFIFTDSEIKDENFLEYLNSILLTGEVAGLFPKDEMLAMCADLQSFFEAERPGLDPTPDNLKQYFVDLSRDHLHVVLCMSPVNVKFPERARKFPGLISGCTIDWFLPWPEEALSAVAQGFLGDFHIECDASEKEQLILHMGAVHTLVTETCDDYFTQMRRHVYQTPKSYLSFLEVYRQTYQQKLDEIKHKEESVNLGLTKLVQGAEDVEKMKLVLADKAKELEKATEETNKMLSSLEVSSHEAKKESDKVAKIKTGCEAEAERIAVEKSACEADLAKAQPYVDEAERAIQSIKPGDISEMKALKKPSDIIRLVFDGVLILFCGSLNPVKAAGLVVAKQEIAFIEPSYNFASSLMADPKFLAKVMEFGRVGKDNINEETIEFMLPYIEMEQFTPKNAKSASKAAEGLCVWVTAMKFYHEASKIIKPKLEALGVAEAQMEIAERELAQAEAREEECRAMLSKLQQDFEAQMGAKQEIEAGAATLKKKMDMASALINGLAGERERWTEDSKSFADIKRRLVGDCAVACAFVSYCGPFNAPFRELLVSERFTTDLQNRQVPVTEGLEVTDFLVDIGTVGDWNLQGLPTDQLSVQNGILVTRSSRYPLLCDPQGQALNWIKNKESENMPIWGPTAINSNKLKDQLEFCMAEGKALVIVGVEQDIDPMLDPVMEKRIIKKAKSKYINVADKMCEFDDNFRLYFITRLPNPHFSPELQAKTTLVDFTVTMKGLEDQLLGRVIGKEQRALEEQLTQVLEEVNANTKALLQLDALLLERLTSNEGNLLDDTELVGVLANTKAKAGEVKEKLQSADDTRRSINEKREQFRPVATRGSVLYFSIVEMQGVNDMYQTSLAQFLELFMRSMDVAEKASLASKRVNNIIDSMTYLVYRYINRGLYEPDKLLFVFIVTLKILVSAGMISPSEVSLFLRGGAALDINSERKKPFAWLSNESWLNALALSKSYPSFFKALPDSIAKNEALWRRWYEDNEPEAQNIPDFETPIAEDTSIGPFLRLLLVRMLRMDRALLVIKEFVRHTEAMGPRYVEPVTDTIESIFDGMVAEVPVIFLLSVGGDPTDSIEVLAKKKKQSVQCVSMGQGQEPVAIKAINAAAVNGSWVLLQNCELGLGLMVQMEDLIIKIREGINPDFRLFITAMPSSEFPLGLLQMGTKVTNEPPAGLQAGCLRSFTVMVDQDRLERIETPAWRQLIFGLCFLHSSVVERRKFGPLGWNIPYEYNDGDLNASLMFIEKHLYSGAISWPTVQYMVSEVQYGGKITDDMDRRLFATYAETWMSPRILEPDFTYNPATPIAPIPGAFVYTVFASTEIERYRAVASSFPEIDSPEIFGLHPNADLTFRVKEVTAFVNVMSDTQPKESGGGGGATREDVVMEKASELLKQLPEDYIEDDYMSKIRGKLGGMKIPLNIFLFQEIQRLQRVIARVRNMLTAMQQAIRGEVVMTTELLESINDIYDARVPKSWLYNPGGSEFSWLLPTLGLWFTSLLERDAQNRGWLNSGRPNAFWLTGFFNPQGFLTGMKQEVTRKHKGWAIDNVVYLTEVTKFDRIEQVRQGPAEGVFIHGLFLDGAGWDKASDTIVESEPKKMFASLPVLHVTGVTKADKAQKRDPSGFYECPCYKYPARTDRYRIFMVDLPTTTLKPRHWILRGAALLCSTD